MINVNDASDLSARNAPVTHERKDIGAPNALERKETG
jgi:hypothetical protein